MAKLSSWGGESIDQVASDGDLVVAFRDARRDAAYGELVRRHQIKVFRLLLGLLAGADESEEATEDVFVKAAKDIAELDKPNRFLPWIVSRARTLAENSGTDLTAITPSVSGEMLAADARLRAAVQSALSEMSPDERAVLILAELEQSAPEEIADTLGRSPEEIRTLIGQARQKLLTNLRTTATPSATPRATALEAGAVLDGRFQIKGVIGEGGMGAVYRAEHVGLGRDVAVKVMRVTDPKARDELRERFRREALVLGQAKHPNFVDVTDFGETTDGTLYLALELLEGDSLGAVLEDGPLDPVSALRVVRHVLRGLAFLHGQGVAHRDIKPESIVLVEQDGDPLFAKILDLGIAGLITSSQARPPTSPKITQESMVVGTPQYIAPEQTASSDVDGRADLYGLPVVLFELLAGELPFNANSAILLMAMHLSTPPPALAHMNLSFTPSAALGNLVHRGLAKKPSQRFASAEEFLAEVERFLPPKFGGTGELSIFG